jgi:hypothetical protein
MEVKKIEVHEDFRTIPKRKISEAEKQIIMLKIERIRLQRERSSLILNKGVMLFFAFIAVAVIGLLNNIITAMQLNLLVIFGVAVLIISVIPYGLAASKEEKDLDDTIKELTE